MEISKVTIKGYRNVNEVLEIGDITMLTKNKTNTINGWDLGIFLMTKAFQELFPNIAIECLRYSFSDEGSLYEDAIYDIRADIRGLITNISAMQLSNHIKDVLMIMTAATIANVRNMPVIAFDDIDIYRYPNLPDIINKISGDCKIIYATL